MFLLKQILAREAKLRGLICSFKNIKFQGKTIRPIGPRQKHSIVFEMNIPSQLNCNLSNCEVARKKKSFSGLQWDSDPWPLRSRCSALPAEL